MTSQMTVEEWVPSNIGPRGTNLPCGCATAITIRHAHFEGNFICLQPIIGIPVRAWVIGGGREGVEPSDWCRTYETLDAAEEAFDAFEVELREFASDDGA